MAAPLSNTHLRVPHGFRALLEGLAREVLRDQPEDIPTYAALHFEALLKERERSDVDPAEWAAKLEDRFYNNHVFKTCPKKEPVAEKSSSEEKSSEYQSEDEPNHPVQVSSTTINPNASEEVLETESKGKEEKQNPRETDVISVKMNVLSEESDNPFPVTDANNDELDGTEENQDTMINVSDPSDRVLDENIGRLTETKDICQSELEPTDFSSFRYKSNIDVCTKELEMTKDKGEPTFQKHEVNVGSEEIKDTAREEQNTKLEEETEELPYSGLADMNVCAEGLGITTEETIIGAVVDDDHSDVQTTEQEDTTSSEMTEITVPSSLLQIGAHKAKIHEMEDQEEETLEGKKIETNSCFGEIHEPLPTKEDAFEEMPQLEGDLDSNVGQKEETLVEISFEDVPEVQSSTVVEEKQPKMESLAALQTDLLEMQPLQEFTGAERGHIIHGHDENERVEKEVKTKGEEMSNQQDASYIAKERVNTSDTHSNDIEEEEKKIQPLQEFTGVARDYITQGHDDTEGIEKKVNPEGKEMTSQQEFSYIVKKKVDTSDSHSSDTEEEKKGKSGKSSSHQPTTDTVEESPEDKTYDDTEDQDNEQIVETDFSQNEDSEIERTTNGTNIIEKTDNGGEDNEDPQIQGFSGMEQKLTHEAGRTEMNISQANGAECETTEGIAASLPEEWEMKERSPAELWSEDTSGRSKQQVSKTGQHVKEKKIDSEGKSKDDAVNEECSVRPTHSADWGQSDDKVEESGPPGLVKDTKESKGKSNDEEECSRPQEEEEDIMDIPLDDPEANKAAAKIQAGFRGHMTRKKMKPEDKTEGEEVSSTGEVLNGNQGDTETGGSRAVERDDTSVPEQ